METLVLRNHQIWEKRRTGEAAILKYDDDGFPCTFTKCRIEDLRKWIACEDRKAAKAAK